MRRRLNTLIFFTIVSLFFAMASFAIGHMLRLVFDISDGNVTVAMMIAMFAAGESFIFASLIGARYYNRFSRWFYTASAVSLGILTYFFLGSCVYALVAVVTGDSLRILGSAIVIVASILSIYGILNARRIVGTSVTVAIKNLPDAWHNRRLVFVSDVHLGQVNGVRFSKRIAEHINAQKPDLVCIGGDLFDGTTAPDLSALAAPFADIKAPFGTYFIMGNHEEFGANTPFTAALEKLGIEMLVDRMITIDGVQCIGVDYHSTKTVSSFEEVLERLSIDPDKPSILFKHEPRNLLVADAHGIALQLSGHTHRGQFWPWRYVTRQIYGVFDYGLHVLGGLQVYTSSGVGTWGPPLKVGSDPEVVILTLNRG